MGAAHAKRRPGQDGEGDAVRGARVAGEDEWEEEDDVGGDHGGNALPPRHSEVDEAAGQVVGRHPYHQAYP